ncbi:TetR family transcriptional regulator [Ancylobacter sp. Lp-2]|uniref:TetR/AcrR family transcriptional regulator n=1 Tax=Ancylobacter sp. Lp-2 TaxID=2881339 RepID=UPI001E659F83|nr:TetR family transcriptional regulator [Ancylobacter sp. Lp-2]MCB4770414.1 TetR family transcriptional regulator [Ancylobacter sp. Lp-2]
MATVRKQASTPGAATRERILDAARDLFAEHGVQAVSLRELTSHAGVNLAAIHYHFGSKEALLAELFSRSSQPIVQWRLELLAKVRREPDGRPVLEDVLEAFLRPALSSGRRQNATFVRLRARLALERNEATRRILRDTFDESSQEVIAAIAEALPDLPELELYWRFHFLIGSMFYTMADSGRIQSLSGGKCDPGNVEEVLARLVPIFANVFREGCNAAPVAAPSPLREPTVETNAAGEPSPAKPRKAKLNEAKSGAAKSSAAKPSKTRRPARTS